MSEDLNSEPRTRTKYASLSWSYQAAYHVPRSCKMLQDGRHSITGVDIVLSIPPPSPVSSTLALDLESVTY